MATATAVDVKELPNSFVFVVDVPGLKNNDVKIQVENDSILKISGDRKPRDEGGDVKYVRVERPTGKFMRKFNLPSNANVAAISAACQDGLLTIVLPKLPPPQPHKPKTFEIPVATSSLNNSSSH